MSDVPDPQVSHVETRTGVATTNLEHEYPPNLNIPSSTCARSGLRLQPAQRGSGHPVRAFGSSAGSRLVRMNQSFDPERGRFVPETFIRGISRHGMRLVTYVVAEIIDVWHIPVPWWQSECSNASGASGQDQGDEAETLAPISRTVWRVMAIPLISFAGYHICGGVMDLAHDPDGTWSVVRIHD